MDRKTCVVIGAGPAGLTAAYELLDKTPVKPVVLETSGDIGGISKTVNYRGNRIDIGGHRFFSKSEKVTEWWLSFLELQGAPAKDDLILGRSVPLSGRPNAPDPETADRVMLTRSRLSRILYSRKFYDYPITLNLRTAANLGASRILDIASSYLLARIRPIREEKSLEDFFINRFGRELYRTFFRDYTEKVWGIGCDKISPKWGAQRVKGLSLSKAVRHAARSMISGSGSTRDRTCETSLIDRFLYPKYGPGQLWETVAGAVRDRGGEIHLHWKATGMLRRGNRIASVEARNRLTGETRLFTPDYVLSSMPVKDLARALSPSPPGDVRDVAEGLRYRDFITVGLLLRSLKIRNDTGVRTVNDIIPDNWIYVQENDVRLGRIQVFNNWSPYMVRDMNTVWLGLEYFCEQGDELWTLPDDGLRALAAAELCRMGIIDEREVIDGVVIRMPDTYPAYFGTYDRFPVVSSFTDAIENLFLIGRNGMHRYNNMDHSMLSAFEAVKNIRHGIVSKKNVWSVNSEETYIEEGD